MSETTYKSLICIGIDHQPNPCQVVPDGSMCVECGGFIIDMEIQEVQGMYQEGVRI